MLKEGDAILVEDRVYVYTQGKLQPYNAPLKLVIIQLLVLAIGIVSALLYSIFFL